MEVELENKDNAPCALCSEYCDDFQVMNDDIQEMLNILLLNQHISVDQRTLLCKICINDLKHCYDFKTSCLHIESCISSFMNSKNVIMVNIKEMYQSQKGSKALESLPDDHTVCRLCMDSVKSNCCISLNCETKDITLRKILLHRYFPELDLNITEDPVMCINCSKFLQSYFDFIRHCPGLERNSKEGPLTNEANNIPDVTSDNILIICENDNVESKVTETNMEYANVAPEYVDVKMKQDDLIRPEENCTVKPQLKTNLTEAPALYYECNVCNFKTHRTFSLEIHSFSHKHSAKPSTSQPKPSKTSQINFKVPRYRCDVCHFTSTRKRSFQQHVALHGKGKSYECPDCDYKTTHSGHLRKHIVIHQRTPEVTMYQCDHCEFQTRHKSSITSHKLIHKSSLDVEMYQCSHCGFQTKYKRVLVSHEGLHRNESAIPKYQCQICEFNFKHERNLKRHCRLVHEKDSKAPRYQCDKCDFKTRYKSFLPKHILVQHSDPDQVPMHCCKICDFKSKHQTSLDAHSKVHREEPDVIMYECKQCDYKTKYKGNVKSHMVNHKSDLEVAIYQCEQCQYKSKHKGAIMRHVVVHRDVAEVDVFKCDRCNFKSKHRSSFTRHINKTHQVVSKVID